MILPAFTQGIYGRLRQQTGADWQQRGGEARFAELSTIFTTATRLEANFWQMGLNAVAERPA